MQGRAQVRISVGSLANKSKPRETNLESPVQAKVKGTGRTEEDNTLLQEEWAERAEGRRGTGEWRREEEQEKWNSVDCRPITGRSVQTNGPDWWLVYRRLCSIVHPWETALDLTTMV